MKKILICLLFCCLVAHLSADQKPLDQWKVNFTSTTKDPKGNGAVVCIPATAVVLLLSLLPVALQKAMC